MPHRGTDSPAAHAATTSSKMMRVVLPYGDSAAGPVAFGGLKKCTPPPGSTKPFRLLTSKRRSAASTNQGIGTTRAPAASTHCA